MDKNTLALIVAAGAVLFLSRRSGTAASPSLIRNGTLEPSPGGGYRFPALPQDAFFTTDPATGQVYVVESGYGGALPWVSMSDRLRSGG